MKTTLSQMTILGGLCVLLAGTATAAFAQGDNHRDNNGDQGGYNQRQFDQRRGGQYGDSQYRNSDQYRHANQAERRRLDRLHAAYARAATHGNYNAAERDHLHAQAIRARLRAQHANQYRGNDHFQGGDQHRDNNQYRGGNQGQGDQHQGNPGQGNQYQGGDQNHNGGQNGR